MMHVLPSMIRPQLERGRRRFRICSSGGEAPRQGAGGFTLIEILMVVTIMALMLSFTAGISEGVVNSMNFRQAIQNVKAQLESARQTAMTTNSCIAVRIVEGRDEMGNVAWRGLQIGAADPVTDPGAGDYQRPVPGTYQPRFKQLNPVERLPGGFVFHPSATYSTLLSNHASLTQGSEGDPMGGSRKYSEFVFLPDGRCSLPSGVPWTLTIVRERDAATDSLPADYAAIQLDSRTARARVYRR